MNCCMWPIEIQGDFCAIKLLSCKRERVLVCSCATQLHTVEQDWELMTELQCKQAIYWGCTQRQATKEEFRKVVQTWRDSARKTKVQLEPRPIRDRKGSKKCFYHYIAVSPSPLCLVAGFKESYQQWVKVESGMLTSTSPWDHPRVMRELVDVLVKALSYLKECGNHRNISDEWRKVNVTLISKNGQVIIPGNCRLVSCTSVPRSNLLWNTFLGIQAEGGDGEQSSRIYQG